MAVGGQLSFRDSPRHDWPGRAAPVLHQAPANDRQWQNCIQYLLLVSAPPVLPVLPVTISNPHLR